MDGYGFKLNELAASKKLTTNNWKVWEITIRPHLYSAGCESLILEIHSKPPVLCPVNCFAPGSMEFIRGDELINKWDRSNSAGVHIIALNVDESQRSFLEVNNVKVSDVLQL